MGCVTDGGGGGGECDVDRDRLSRSEDNVAKLTFGTDTNAPLVYAPVLEHQHPIISNLGDPRGQF